MVNDTPFESQFQTPLHVCRYMRGIIPPGVKTVLEPTPGDGNIVNILEQANYDVTAPKDIWELEKQRFDCVVMNPPFTPMEVGYEILFLAMEMSDNVIALMPWLTIINSEKRTEELRRFGIRRITHLPRSVFKGSRVQTCILELVKGYSNQTIFSFYKSDL